jgi:hypothetical protein
VNVAFRRGLFIMLCLLLAACAAGEGSQPPAGTAAPAPQPSATPEGALQALMLTSVFVTPGPTLTPLPVIVQYQPFEHGFLLQRGGEQCVYAYTTLATASSLTGSIVIPAALAEQFASALQYCIPVANLNENPPVEAAPDGLLTPQGIFLQVWAAYEEIRLALGYATAAAVFHAAPMPARDPNAADAPVAPLPDGRALYCGTQVAQAGLCSVR